MLKLNVLIIILFLSLNVYAQTYQTKIEQHRAKYKKEFLEDEKSPLKQEDLKYLRFFQPNEGYIVQSHFSRVNDSIGFEMQTHNGVIKKYFVYGYVTFILKKRKFKLFVYQSEKLRMKEGFEDYLFIPFTDETNYKETFGGGRYLDFRFNDIRNNTLLIDFNKCYNPYCAFKEGYACPIPPKENDMKVAIKAGEKLFGRDSEKNK